MLSVGAVPRRGKVGCGGLVFVGVGQMRREVCRAESGEVKSSGLWNGFSRGWVKEYGEIEFSGPGKW